MTTTSRLAYTTRSGNPRHADVIASAHAAAVRPATMTNNEVRALRVAQFQRGEISLDTLSECLDAFPPDRICSVTVPEPHERGEFPMTCFACHMVADA